MFNVLVSTFLVFCWIIDTVASISQKMREKIEEHESIRWLFI